MQIFERLNMCNIWISKWRSRCINTTNCIYIYINIFDIHMCWRYWYSISIFILR